VSSGCVEDDLSQNLVYRCQPVVNHGDGDDRPTSKVGADTEKLTHAYRNSQILHVSEKVRHSSKMKLRLRPGGLTGIDFGKLCLRPITKNSVSGELRV